MNKSDEFTQPSDPAPEQQKEICKSCSKLVAEYRKANLAIPPWIQCAYGHRLIDYPKGCYEPERLPVWAWTRPLRDKNTSGNKIPEKEYEEYLLDIGVRI